MEAPFEKVGTEKLSSDIERHLRRYFDLHGNILPPVGLYNRILKELEIPLMVFLLKQQVVIKLSVQIYWELIEILCVKNK